MTPEQAAEWLAVGILALILAFGWLCFYWMYKEVRSLFQ